MDDDGIIDHVLEFEGGYVNNPNDRGGPTNFGITARTLGAYQKPPRAMTPGEVAAMPVGEARDIYKSEYISEPNFDAITDGILRLVIVDCAVLYGTRRAAIWLQTALNVTADGVIGSNTQIALASANPATIARTVLSYRYQRIKDRVAQDPSQMIFYKGWMSRTDQLLKIVGAP